MRLTLLFTLILLLSACSKDEESMKPVAVRKATITLLVSVNGMGDNGYNDAAAEGIFTFASADGARVRLLMPDDEAEAEMMYRDWLAENAMQDSTVLIIASSAYEGMARRVSAAEQDRLLMLKEHGGRVLLFESDAEIDGISTVKINRYGVCYLAGAMSQGFDALILVATKHSPLLEEAIAGFRDGHGRYAGTHDGMAYSTALHYLAEDERGFAMPDSAYRFVARRSGGAFVYEEMIFPLLGGSAGGVVRFLNDDMFMQAMMVGMDVDQGEQSRSIPFSVVIRIGDVLGRCLADWRDGKEWPRHRRVGMRDGATDIVVTPGFVHQLSLSNERFRDTEGFMRMRESYKQEAMTQEERFYE